MNTKKYKIVLSDRERSIVKSILSEQKEDTTVQSVKTKFALYGLDNALYAAKRETPPITPKYTDAEAKIIALAQSVPPDGKKKWTVRLLTEYCAKLGYSDSISYPTVFRILKKNGITI